MQSTLIIAGVVFVGAAIVGGGMVAFKVEVPLIDSLARQILLGVFGTALLVAGLVTGDSSPTAESQADPSDVSTATTGQPPPTTSALEAPPEDRHWQLVLDTDGKLGVSIPADWTVTVTEETIWASESNLEDWLAATRGEGPADANGYMIRREQQPVSGSFEDIANEFLSEMPVPQQCALVRTDTERPVPGTFYVYDVYQCAPGGEFVNEVEIGFNPPWVTLESSRYLDNGDRDGTLARIWESVTAY